MEKLTGLMERNTKVTGRTIKWMERVFSNGQMAGSMRETTIMTKNMDSVVCGGQMDDNTRVNGRTEFSMDRANTKVVTVSGNRVVGNSASVFVDDDYFIKYQLYSSQYL